MANDEQQHIEEQQERRDAADERAGGTATATRTRPSKPRLDRLPPYRVLLHNDDVNDVGYVVDTILELTTLTPQMALIRMLEAHHTGQALLLTTHREYAELLCERFDSKQLTVSMEPA